jgi:hypothetical protein
MEKLQELFDSLKANWTAFEAEHNAFVAKGNKAASGRARKAIQALKKDVTDYKKASVEATKA